MPRAQNAHAYVNAAFLIEWRNNKVTSANICFGGINPEFTHARQTEEKIIGIDLYTNEALTILTKSLASEIKPDYVLLDATPEYRQNLAIALFYKFVPKYKSIAYCQGRIQKWWRTFTETVVIWNSKI